MASPPFATSDAQVVKLWTQRALQDSISDKTLVGQMIGDGSLIRKDELQKKAGDFVRVDFLNRLSNKGLIGDAVATGNEKVPTYYQDSMYINELRQPIIVPNKNTIGQQRTMLDLEEDSYSVLEDWMIERQTVSVLNQLAGFAPTSFTYDGETFTGNERLELWGMNTPTDATSTRVIRSNGHATDVLVNADSTATFKLSLIQQAEAAAQKSRPYITGLDTGMAGVKYRCYVHVDQFYQIQNDTTAPQQYRDIILAQIAGGHKKEALIGQSFVFSMTEIICTDKVPNGVTSSSVNANTRRAIFVGKNAGCIMFGQGYGSGKNAVAGFRFNQDVVDIGKSLRIAIANIWGVKKLVFNSIDNATIAITTYVA